MERLGKVSEWNDDRGFGFIAPLGGEPARVFFHVRDYRLDGRRPETGELVKFTVQPQPDGRWRAQAVRRTVSALPSTKPSTRARTPSPQPASWLTGAVAVAAYAVLLAWAVGDDRLPVEAVSIPLAMSAITFVAYALDKHAAQTGRWRTPESTLHLLELAGGWPGAWLAQRMLRHKSRKPGYRIAFWTMVVLHGSALVVGCWMTK